LHNANAGKTDSEISRWAVKLHVANCVWSPYTRDRIAFGANAGFNLTTGSNNVDVYKGGVAGEANTFESARWERISTPLSLVLAELPLLEV